MKIHFLSGFLGSGKTTAIREACKALLRDGIRPAVIMNDQGSRLVDSDYFQSLGVPGRQVANGCFCCNYDQLDDRMQSLGQIEQPDIIFAESVGSCTDIVATVLRPLQKFRSDSPVTLTVFADIRLLDMLLSDSSPVFDESVAYIYFKQLEEAAVIVISKTDLVSSDTVERIRSVMRERYGQKELLFQNSFDEHSIRQWLRVLDRQQNKADWQSLQIDYDLYGAGEALLAWLDQDLEILGGQNGAIAAAGTLTEKIYRSIRSKNLPIGHLKFLINNEVKISFVQSSPEVPDPSLFAGAGNKASLLINARVQTDPETLSGIVDRAIAETSRETGCRIGVGSFSSFQPGYPTPTHRITS